MKDTNARLLRRAAVGLALLCGSCGGIAVIDGSGSGSGGSANSSSGVGGQGGSLPSSSASGNSCAGPTQAVEEAIKTAQACEPGIDVIQCSGATTIFNECGCVLVVNDLNPGAAGLALMAYEGWVELGCGPYDCDTCPPPPDSAWYCDPGAKACAPGFE